MGTYQWTNALSTHVYTLGHPPLWWNNDLTPKLAVSTESPGGPGDILVRSELYIAASALIIGEPLTTSPNQLQAISILALGEVYPVGVGGIPDPSAGGVESGVITAASSISTYNQPDTAASKAVATWQTGGYVSSKGRRGPAKYGDGHPELRIGIWATNIFELDIVGEIDSSECYHVRALWYTP